jgi:phage terminase small subunit
MGKVIDLTDRAAVLKALLAAANRPAQAALYADTFVEYQEAMVNIRENGAIVADARTGAAIQNPYLVVRDKAFARLELLHKAKVKADALWV